MPSSLLEVEDSLVGTTTSEEADEAAGAEQATSRGQLRVYCQQGVVRFVTPVVSDFLARYSEASVDLRAGPTRSTWCRRCLTWGSVRSHRRTPPSSDGAWGRWASVCGAPGLPSKNIRRRTPPADLAGHNCLRYPHVPSPDEWDFVDARGNPVVARISGRLISSHYETTRDAAVAGIGLLLTAPFLVADLIGSGALVPLLPGYQAQEVEINALYPHRRHLSCKVRVFIDMLADRFVEQQRWLDAKAEQ